MIRWHLATDEQLEVIFNHDANTGVKNEILVDLMSEMIVRKKIDGLIIKKAKELFGEYDRDEVLQTGYIAVYQLSKIFKPGDLSFKSMCFIAIERRLKNILEEKNRIKNKLNSNALMYEVPEMIDDRNIERAVIRKFELQEQLDKLNEKERIIIELFLQGYSMRWMDTNVFNRKITYTKKYFKSALKKMGIENYRVNRGATA